MNKPIASLSLDLDNKWSYLKIHGDAGWEDFPSYLDTVVPISLQFFREHGLKITYFIVGQDAALDKNHDAIKSIALDGHEIGNHSFHHESWLHLYSESEIESELANSEEHLERLTGQRTIGFRGPGFSFSPTLLRVLARRGYRYDASTFPTILGPVARAYYFMTSKLDAAERKKRKGMFGGFKQGFGPLNPFRWSIRDGDREQGLIEMPVTTMPLARVPIHFSYIFFLATFSTFVAVNYLRCALLLCKWTGTQPSLLLHPLDFLGGEDVPELAFFPGMKLRRDQKLKVLDQSVRLMKRLFDVQTMSKHAEMAAANKRLGVRALGRQ